jgi:acyl-CoA reductase-like NAD-dependent aldehyde dehydrogenase
VPKSTNYQFALQPICAIIAAMAQPMPAKSDPAELISRNPATGEEIGRAPLTSPEEVARAVSRAREAQPAWAAKSFRERGRLIMNARGVILDDLEEIALLVSQETGKPVAEAISMELASALDLMQYCARRSAALLWPKRISVGQYALMGRSSYEIYKPLGVIGIISPWNFPCATPLAEVVMALMAGNAVVLKPSELTPLTGLKIKEVLSQAGLDEGLLQVTTGDGSTGAALVGAGVDKIIFTGSVNTGKRVAEAAARYLIPVVLELGGKDPMIVLDDVDVVNAARGAVWGAFANCGQACASVERCYVHESIAQQFLDAVVAETKRLRVGRATEPDIDIGPMMSERQLLTVERHVDEAVGKGATVLIGGHRVQDSSGPFYQPTVLTSVTHEMTIMRNETFGPVLPIMTFKTDDEAVRLANDSLYGLTASVWTKNIDRGKRLAERIDAGTVMVNDVVYTHAIASTPWGGVKHSGMGHTHGRAGLLELVRAQHIHVNRWSFLPDLWWFEYGADAGRLFRGFARRFASGSVLQSCLLLPQMIRRWRARRKV